MKLFTVVSLIACFSGVNAEVLNLSALLGGAAAPANSTAPVVPAPAPPTPAAPLVAPGATVPVASAVPVASVAPTQAAPVATAAPANPAAPTSKAPCPYANKGTSPAPAPAPGAGAAPAAASGASPAGSAPPAAAAQPVVGTKAREMDNQMTNLRTAIELFQDFQRQYQLADDNPIMQQIYQLFNPILQAANNIR